MQSKRYSSAFGQTAANDAQKRQKTPLIVVKSSLFIASRRLTRDFRKKQRKHLAEYIMAELLPLFALYRWKRRYDGSEVEIIRV